MAKKKLQPRMRHHIDIDFYSMEFYVVARGKAEARKKARKMIARKILSHIHSFYVEKGEKIY